MARIQKHHITYKPAEWLVEMNMLQHRAISRVQMTKATDEAYMYLTNFIHALSFEWNRMRMELDTGKDCRVLDYSGAKIEKKIKVSDKQAKRIVQDIKFLVMKSPVRNEPKSLLLSLRPVLEEAYRRKKRKK